jgi:hypothetical protein
MSEPKISISLPSIYEGPCIRTLKNLRDAIRSTYEVILVSPFPPPAEFAKTTTWIEEKRGTGDGCNAGHAQAFEHMRGEYVMAWVDDHLVTAGFDCLAIQDLNDMATDKPFLLGLRHIEPRHVGTEFGIYYPYFPFARRADMEEIGWYDPQYKKGFADGDLAFRVWSMGGSCAWSNQGLVCVTPDDDRKAGVIYDESDYTLFVKRWGPKYGKGWDTKTLRGFNMDVVPENMLKEVKDNAIFQNDPGFRERAIERGWRP